MNDGPRTLELSAGRRQGSEGRDDIWDDLMVAVDAAAEQGRVTWVTYNGTAYCAIVPAGMAVKQNIAEAEERMAGREPMVTLDDALDRTRGQEDGR